MVDEFEPIREEKSSNQRWWCFYIIAFLRGISFFGCVVCCWDFKYKLLLFFSRKPHEGLCSSHINREKKIKIEIKTNLLSASFVFDDHMKNAWSGDTFCASPIPYMGISSLHHQGDTKICHTVPNIIINYIS